MIKSNGGSGTVVRLTFYLERHCFKRLEFFSFQSSVTLQNFFFKGSAYGLDIDSAWGKEAKAPGDGVQLSNITVANWNGMICE
jgi:hypothetical protein